MIRLILCFFMLLTSLNAQDVVGRVTALQGQVVARSLDAGERVLQNESLIYVKDSIETGTSSSVQIHFSDGGVLDLIENTTFKINEYNYRKAFRKDTSSTELVKGGLRTLTGSIAKKNPAGYEIKTPNATIGVRGTIIQARIGVTGVYVGVSSGIGVVTNNAASVLIGPSQSSEFAFVAERNQTPELLTIRPEELRSEVFVMPPGSSQLETLQQQSPQKRASKSDAGIEDGTAPKDQKDERTTRKFGGASIQGGC